MNAPRRLPPEAPSRRGWCPGLSRPMPTGDGLLARIHPPLGILSLAQARAVAEGARRFGNGHIDLTARANLQIRGVGEATRAPLARLLEAAGLGDARHDGGPQRLTLTSPLAGLYEGAEIDVTALARSIEARGLAVAGLPAKTLVIVEGGSSDLAGLEADIHVRAAGPGRTILGLATDHAPRWIAECDEAETADRVVALLHAFARTGRRRMRDLSPSERASLAPPPPFAGEGGPRSGSGEWSDGSGEIAALSRSSPTRGPPSPAEGGGIFRPNRPRPDESAPADPIPATGLTILPDGLIILSVEAPFGRCTVDGLDRLAQACLTLGAKDIRLSPTRGFVLAARPPATDRSRPADAQDVLAILSADFITGPDDPRRAVAACPGAPACVSGSTPTTGDAARLADAFRPLAARGLRAHVSGCAKGCAHPGRTDLTLIAREGHYGVVLDGAAGDFAGAELTFEAALERVRRADLSSLAEAFGPGTLRTTT